MTIIRSKCVGK